MRVDGLCVESYTDTLFRSEYCARRLDPPLFKYEIVVNFFYLGEQFSVKNAFYRLESAWRGGIECEMKKVSLVTFKRI